LRINDGRESLVGTRPNPVRTRLGRLNELFCIPPTATREPTTCAMPIAFFAR
jgi:hypothetical protein